MDTFINNPNCTNTTSPENFGYSPKLHTDSFNIKFDVRSVFTCVALNSRIAGIPNMIQTQSFVALFEGKNYTGGQFVDPQFPGMKPVFCLLQDNSTYNPVCLIIVGNVYAVPLFNHAGLSFNLPLICNCTEQLEYSDVSTNMYNMCKFIYVVSSVFSVAFLHFYHMFLFLLFYRAGNIFNFLTGFLFYPTAAFNPDAVLELLFKYSPNSTDPLHRSLGRTLNELAFAPMFTAGMYGQMSPNRTVLNAPANREAMYEFCYNKRFGPCSMVTFNSIDESQQSTDWIVSDNFFQLTIGACTDSFSTTWEAW